MGTILIIAAKLQICRYVPRGDAMQRLRLTFRSLNAQIQTRHRACVDTADMRGALFMFDKRGTAPLTRLSRQGIEVLLSKEITDGLLSIYAQSA